MKNIKEGVVRRNTRQRTAIYRVLKNVKTHPTAREIHQMVAKDKPNISLGTVYRNLSVLESEGLIMRLRTKDKDARFDACTESHAHLFCTKCGYVEDIFDITKMDIKSKTLEQADFQIRYNFLELHGLCAGCRGG